MKDNWEKYKLGDFLKRTNRFEVKDDFTSYTFSGTYSFSRGIFKSYTKNGIEFNLKKVQRLKTNDFVYCKIMAWEGAFGLVPVECDGTVMSGAFIVYEINEDIVEPKYLDFYFKLENNWRPVSLMSTGTNIRRKSLHPDDFEQFKIPLPPLSEQKRIVAKIESIKGKIETIQIVRAEQEKEMENLRFSIYEEAEKDFQNISLKELLQFSNNWEDVTPEKIYRQMGIRVWGKGGYKRENLNGFDTKYTKLMRVEENDLVINKIWVRNGALTIVGKELGGCFVSTEFPTFKYDTKLLNPGWIGFIIKQRRFWELCSEKSYGTSGKNRIKPQEFLSVEIPLPPIKKQNVIVSLLDKMEQIQLSYQQQEIELTELLSGLLDKAFKGNYK